MKYLYLKSRRY